MRAPDDASIPSLDGIRALAVGMVFLAHSGLEHFVPGGLGVTVFFVLSGFLITTLLRQEFAARGSIDFRAFWLRRGLRLLPPLVLVVALGAALSALGLVEGEFSAAGLASVLFYWGNYHMIADDFGGVPSGFGVMWSLAVEEHYYLFYPPLALLLLRAARVRLAAQVLGGALVAVLLWRVVLFTYGVPEAYITMATDTRIDAILAGALLAFVRNPWLAAPSLRVSAARDAAVVGACLAVLAASLLIRDELFRQTLRYTVQIAAIVPLLWLAVAHARLPLFRWLGWRPVVYVGRISYTVYLCHHLLLSLVAEQFPALGWLPATLLGAVLTLAVAAPMRHWVERPCARLRHRLHKPKPAVPPLLPEVAS